MVSMMMDGVVLTPLKQINNPKGDIYHALKQSEKSFNGFGEAYFSSVIYKCVKGWKKHTKMILNLIVPVGEVRFVLFDDRTESATYGEFFEITLSQNNYCRLTVPKNVWMAFQGKGTGLNLLLNIASIEHSPEEAINTSLENINFNWSTDE